MSTTVLFVYGTLKRGEMNEFRMGDCKCLGPATTLPIYRLYALGWHPGLVLDKGAGVAVRGELWVVDAGTLAKLDEYEGVPHYFTRGEVAIADVIGDVQAYFFAGDVPPDAPSGDRWPLPA
jgi:gamma-glutamylaminecyclotransferase